MTQREESLLQGKNIDEWGDHIFDAFKARYEYIKNVDGETWFLHGDGAFHLLCFVEPLYGFILEYADGTTERNMAMAEDGDQYSLLDYDTPEDMLQAMIEEIEG